MRCRRVRSTLARTVNAIESRDMPDDFGGIEIDESDSDEFGGVSVLDEAGPDFGPPLEVPRSSEELAQRNFESQRAMTNMGFSPPGRPPPLSQEITQALSVSPQTTQNAAEVARAMRIHQDLQRMGIPASLDDVLVKVAGGKEAAPSPGAQITSGIQNTAAGLIGGLADPEMAVPIAGAVLFPPIAPLVSAGFGAHMMSQVPELARTAGTASAVGTPYEKAKAYADLGATTLMMPALGVHAASPLTRAKAPIEIARQPEVVPLTKVELAPEVSSPKAAEALSAETLLKKKPGEIELSEIQSLPDAELEALVKSKIPEGERRAGSPRGFQDDSIKWGSGKSPDLLPELERLKAEVRAKIVGGDASVANQSRMGWYSGAIEGIKGAQKTRGEIAAEISTPTYDSMLREGYLKPEQPKGAPIEKAQAEEVLTPTPEQVSAMGFGEPSFMVPPKEPPRPPNPPREPGGTTEFPTEGENVKMRKSAERATTSEQIPEPVQERIKTAKESFYKQQSMAKVEDIVSTMNDADLATVPRDSNLYTAARLEQAGRLFKEGKNDAGYEVFVELEKEGTRLGQLINQFKLLKGTRPEEVVRVIDKTLEKSGKDPLKPPQREEAIKKAEKSKEADRRLEESTDEWARNPTPENAAKAEKNLLDANEAGLELQRFVSKYQPRSTPALLKSILQGNLLTPISQARNIVGNMAFSPLRAATRTVATGFDVLNNYLTKSPRTITVQPIRGTAEVVKGFGRGAKQIPEIFLRGTGDTIKGETRAGLHPIKAWINQFAKNPEMPTTGGKITLQDRLNLAIEGTFGVPAEAMLRGLGAGDAPFREAARARATATELSLGKVPKDQWSFAQKFPELFLNNKAMERIQSETLRSVFQQPSKLLSLFTNWLRGRGDWWDLLGATVAPYKLTPWNIIGETLSYNPLIAFARSVHSSKTGNPREARLNAGKFVVGSMLTAAGWWLYKNGLMSPSLDQRDEAQKTRVLAGEVMPPNHINLSGLKRAMSGGDPAFRAGDNVADVFSAGGLAGSMFYMTANIGRDFERKPEVADSEVWGAILRQSTLEQARFGMNQSFLSGVEGLLSAVREGNTDNYVRQWGNTVASIPLPNTLTVMSRASREYKPDFREDTFRKQMENIVRNKLGVANLDDYLPLKRGLWGEPMRETPEGRNAIMYHFFDVFKNKQVTSDPVPLELFRLWRKTADTRVIPSLPEKTITMGGNTYAMDAAQQSRYAELVGQSRRTIVDAIVVNPNFHKLPDESKVEILDRVYRAGLQRGKSEFWREIGGGLKMKPSRAGFAPPE